MSIINRDLLDGKVGSAPLKDYPWQNYADNIIRWARRHDDSYSAFAFDLLMSMAYIDTIENLQNNFSLLSTPYKDHRIQSDTSGIAGGLKYVNRSKRIICLTFRPPKAAY